MGGQGRRRKSGGQVGTKEVRKNKTITNSKGVCCIKLLYIFNTHHVQNITLDLS